MRPRKPFPALRIAAVFILLFTIAIPWWWRWLPNLGNQTLLGAPIWFVTAVVGSFLISAVTVKCLAIAWDALEDEEAES